MIPKETALKLCQTFGKETLFDKECNGGYTLPLSTAKRMGLIAVDEIIIALKFTNDSKYYEDQHNYYQQVKEEINKL